MCTSCMGTMSRSTESNTRNELFIYGVRICSYPLLLILENVIDVLLLLYEPFLCEMEKGLCELFVMFCYNDINFLSFRTPKY